jgi:uncharacterized membrane protein YoaK (UPF0700 family)
VYKPLWGHPYPYPVVLKWLLLAFVAGSVNAGGFMACGRFVSHVTGFGTLFGMEASAAQWGAAAEMLGVPLFFLLGVAVGAFFTDVAIVKGAQPRFGLVLSLAAMLLVVAAAGGRFGWFGIFGDAFMLDRSYPLLMLLCASSGLVNAAVTTSSGHVMRATHLTGTTTDLGIGLVRVLFAKAHPGLMSRERYRSWLRLGQIAAFCAGGLTGAVMFGMFQYLAFLLPAVIALYAGNLGMRLVAPRAVATQLVEEPPHDGHSGVAGPSGEGRRYGP